MVLTFSLGELISRRNRPTQGRRRRRHGATCGGLRRDPKPGKPTGQRNDSEAALAPPPAALAADPLTWGEPLEATVEKEQWQDFYVDVADDDANLYFEVVANSASASALGLYVSEGELRPPAERLSPGAFLDYDETSMIASGSREEPKRKFSVVVSQCYVQPHTKYYLSVRGGKDAASVSYKITAMRVAARIPLNGTVSGSLCDNRYLHYFWELPATPTLAGVRTTLRKTSGELDAFFMRYERCAGPIGTEPRARERRRPRRRVALRRAAAPRRGAHRRPVLRVGQGAAGALRLVRDLADARRDQRHDARAALRRRPRRAPAAAAAAALAVAGGWLARRRRSPV